MHYRDPQKVDQLIALGDLATLGQDIGLEHEYPVMGYPHHKETYWCLAFGRDRKQAEDVEAQHFDSFEELAEYADPDRYGAEYLYVYRFRTKTWWYTKRPNMKLKLPELMSLNSAVRRIMAEAFIEQVNDYIQKVRDNRKLGIENPSMEAAMAILETLGEIPD